MAAPASSEFGLNTRQAEAVQSWGRGDVCVVAGPGSGKTRVLVARFRWLVEEKRIPVRRLLAITFTEKAAAHMRRRLVGSFPPESEARRQVERAYISTVHGFCARLLRENAIEASVDPEFRVLEEWEANFELRRAIDDALESAYQADAGAARQFLSRFGAPDVAECIFSVYGALRAAGVPAGEAGRMADRHDWREKWRELREAFEKLARLPTERWKPSQRAALDEFLASGRPVSQLGGQAPGREHFRALSEMRVDLGKLKLGSGQRELARTIREDIVPACRAALLLDSNRASRQWFLEALSEADRRYRAGKEAAGALDFADLEEGAIRLLESPAGGRLREEFSFILMDEFQDTNPQQARLVGRLRRPGNFFAVGDINQSIYGFRHADPTVFAAYRQETQERGHVVELFRNYRSRAEILRGVSMIIEKAEGIEPQALEPGRELEPAPAPCLEVLAVHAAESDEALELEARHTGSRIRELASEGRFPYGGIAVLLRTSAQVRVFEREFRRQGIPCEVTEGRGYYEAREVNDLMCFLRVLLNPRDDISLAAVLRSPLAGLSDESLVRLKSPSSRLAESLETAAAELPEGEARQLAQFRERLARYRRDRDYTALDRLLGRLLAETGYESWVRLQPGGAHAVANLRKLLSLARRFSGAGSEGLQGFVERVEDLRREEARESDAQPPDQTADAVELMTVHAAKGLEFPAVFLPAVNRRPRAEADPVRFRPGIGLGMRWRDPVSGEEKPDSVYEAVAEEARSSRREESQRLFYVAMTRAEELLVVSVSFGSQVRAEQWAKNLQDNLAIDLRQIDQQVRIEERQGLAVRVLRTSQEPAPAPFPPAGQPAPAEPAVLERPLVDDQSDTAVAATSVALFAHCPRRYYLSRYLGFDGNGRPAAARGGEERPEPDEMDSSEFGRHVHAVLAGVIPPESAHPEALRLATAFEASHWGRRAAFAEQIHREQSFLLALNGRLLTGQIDLWFREGGETVLIDYKTDEVSAPETGRRAADYEWQLRLYALAVERLGGGGPLRAVLYFLRPNVAVEVPAGRTETAAAQAKVEQLCRAQSSLEFPLRAGDHCFRCPYFRGLCPAKVPPARQPQ
jgi:ATP-dependent helicase/nuclease subunit A